MSRSRTTPLGAVAKGLVAGAIGTTFNMPTPGNTAIDHATAATLYELLGFAPSHEDDPDAPDDLSLAGLTLMTSAAGRALYGLGGGRSGWAGRASGC